MKGLINWSVSIYHGSLYVGLLRLAKKVNKSTFKSIVDKPSTGEGIQVVVWMIKKTFSSLQPLYFPWISRFPLNKSPGCLLGNQFLI